MKRARRATMAMAACAAALGATACLESVDSVGLEELELGTATQALENATWFNFVNESSPQGGLTAAPALCHAYTNAGGYLALGRASSNNRFYWKLFHRFGTSSWTQLGFKQFGNKPACVALDEPGVGGTRNYKKLAFGRATDNLLYVTELSVEPATGQYGEPVLGTVTSIPYAAVDASTTYESAPAAAVGDGVVALVARRSNDNLNMYLSYLGSGSDPFDNSWDGPYTAPALPSGWNMGGDPAIANTTDFFGDMTVVVSATKDGQTKLFTNLFNASGWSGWNQHNTSNIAVGSDAALTVDAGNWVTPLTLWFRGTNNKLYQGSGFYSTNMTYYEVGGSNNTGFAGAPAAIGGVEGWDSFFIVWARKSGDFWGGGTGTGYTGRF